MSLSLYTISIPPFIQGLRVLSHILKQGSEFAAQSGGKVTEEALATSRLIEDQGNLIFQVQRVSDTAKGLAVRIGGAAPVAMADTETTFPELQERIQKTIEVLEKVKESDMESDVQKAIIFGKRNMPAGDYVVKFAMPNFYFHVTTTYALLRKAGVPVGKSDYLGDNL